MKTIEAKFKIATSMFLHGADQTKAELRVPSIKGVNTERKIEWV